MNYSLAVVQIHWVLVYSSISKKKKRKRFSSEISSIFLIIKHVRKEKGNKSNSTRNALEIG